MRPSRTMRSLKGLNVALVSLSAVPVERFL